MRPLYALRSGPGRHQRPYPHVLPKPSGGYAGDQVYTGSFSFLKTTQMRSEEHTSELQSLMRISYAVFCLKKKTDTQCIRPYKQLSKQLYIASRNIITNT